MSELRVNNQLFNYPNSGSEVGWGEDASSWAEAVSTVLDSVAGLGTINETQITIENGESNRQILGMVFNQNLTQAAEIEYRIFRRTDDAQYSEQGRISVTYDPNSVDKWFMVREMGAGTDALTFIDMDAAGQANYTATFMAGANYEGYIRFKTYTTLK